MAARNRLVTAALSLLVTVSATSIASSQSSPSLKTLSGDTVQPAFEGWERNPDGTYNMWFGYFNRNWAQELNIPVGPNNNIQPAF